MPFPRTHYDVLGVAPTATRAEIRAAYRRAVAEVHPDRNPGFATEAAARTAELNAAWSVLCDPDTRAAYDLDQRAPAPDSEPTADAAPGDVSPLGQDIAAGRDALLGLVALLAPDRAPAAARLAAAGEHFARRYLRRA